MHIIYENVWSNTSIENETIDIFTINKLPIKLQMINSLSAFMTNDLRCAYEVQLLNLGFSLAAYKTIIVYFSPLSRFIQYNNIFAQTDKTISIMF